MEKALTNKRWYRLIPIAFITYSLAYLDRANFSFATAGGMAKDLDISASYLFMAGSLLISAIMTIVIVNITLQH